MSTRTDVIIGSSFFFGCGSSYINAVAIIHRQHLYLSTDNSNVFSK